MTENPQNIETADDPDLAVGGEDAVVIALGSNDKGVWPSCIDVLEATVARFRADGIDVLALSSWWRSAAWPDPSAPEYRNGVAIVETPNEPSSVLRTLLSIEAEFNRNRGERNAPRTLDLDLIAHGRVVIDSEDLILPHPRAHTRLFVMGPLAEIAPDWHHPVSGLTAGALAAGASVGCDARAG